MKTKFFLMVIGFSFFTGMSTSFASNAKAKIELGKKLFFEPRLSKTSTLSCNSCHNVAMGGDDGRSTSFGIRGQLGGRNSPTVWNAALNTVQFWDGRAASLKDQAKGPLINPIEMGMENHDAVVARLKDIPDYVKEFKKVFGPKSEINIDDAADAIAAFEETLVVRNSPYDKFLKGNKKALSVEAQKGFENFKSIGCVSCHGGANFAGPITQPGVGFYMKFPTFPDASIEAKYAFTKDLGRFSVTKSEGDKNMYRVPSLRNVAVTAPYFHNGAVNDLKEAVRVMGKLQLNKVLTDAEITSLVAFLESLSDTLPEVSTPRLPGTPGRAIYQ